MDKNRKRAMLSWLFVFTLFVLCALLGVLQYRWIGAVSLAERDRLHSNLQDNLNHLSRDFNSELSEACWSLVPANSQPGDPLPEAAFRAAFVREKIAARGLIFQRIGLALPQDNGITLRIFDPARQTFSAAEWPSAWHPLLQRIKARRQFFSGGPGLPMPPIRDFGPAEALVFEQPLFAQPENGASRPTFGGHETGWLIFEFNQQYLVDALLPELLLRDLGANGTVDYDVQVATHSRPPTVVYRSDAETAQDIAANADASINLFDVGYRVFRRREGSEGPGGAMVLSSMPVLGRWRMYVRHRAGSLEAVVSRARWRNLAVTAGLLLLILASGAALVHFTRQAQRLAGLQMDFVAGISHELRTPLAVIHTAAYNLQGTLARNADQVERYGALIQKESGRLKDLVEKALRFARARTGRVIQESEPLSVEAVIEDTLESTRAAVHGAHCVIESKVQPGLPLILGDALALKHALENLIINAAKYGTETSNWIGVFAAQRTAEDRPVIEIRVVDRGPGIPLDEQPHIFDPFFRGKRAILDQVHGMGLGLSLVKDIVEAHGGSIEVHCEPSNGTEFIVRIPVAPPEYQDEFAYSLS